MTNRNTILALRPDLICKQIHSGSKQIWVVKDPLSRTYCYFDQSEYAMLALADGRRTIDQLIGDCQTLLSPHPISSDALIQFFTSAHISGILLADGRAHQAKQSNTRRWWKNPLAIRLPGINPDRFLDRVLGNTLAEWRKPSGNQHSSAGRRACALPLLGLAFLLMIVASVIAVVYFAELAADFAGATSKLMTGQGLIWLMIAISLTKIIHELAHAVACKYFGGDVLEMGLMLFIGTPCLYCDVSDAWLIPQNWKRILISAAGILAELTIAAVASIIWLLSADGLVQDLCVIVMVVCSITTILFNGNPLLRYDGYFILSDLTGVPNLATEAATQIRSWIRRIFWGTESDLEGRPLVGLYGIASGAYRIGLYSMIAWLFYSVAKQHNLGGPYMFLVLSAFAAIAWKWTQAALTPPIGADNPSRLRPALTVSGMVAAVVVAAFVPIPQSIVAPLTIEPADSHRLFVTKPGRIVEALQPGRWVEKGAVIARLQNIATDRELADGHCECERLRVQLESLRQSRSTNQVSSSRLTAIEKALATASKRLSLLNKNARELEIIAPRNGRLFSARPRADVTTVSHSAGFWTGTPLQPWNRGAWLESGTEIGLVGDASAREAVLLVAQQEVERVQANQHVTFRFADHRRSQITGRVIDIGTSPADDIPPELNIGGDSEVGRSPRYLIRVRLDDTSFPIPIQTTGHAKIKVDSESIAKRMARFLADTLR